jgi:thiopurine S-methyltransferase
MQPGFWHERWALNKIGFHESAANPALVRHFGEFKLGVGSRVFVPLCGKTLDIAWLLSRGYQVVGAELSKLAIDQLFAELGVVPHIVSVGNVEHYQASNIDIFVGDILDVTASMLGKIDAIYDRAALVALPPEMRSKYSAHLLAITHSAPQLLICFEYDQQTMQGPPFAIGADEVRQHYATTYGLKLLERSVVAGKLNGQDAMESVWLLQPQV